MVGIQLSLNICSTNSAHHGQVCSQNCLGEVRRIAVPKAHAAGLCHSDQQSTSAEPTSDGQCSQPTIVGTPASRLYARTHTTLTGASSRMRFFRRSRSWCFDRCCAVVRMRTLQTQSRSTKPPMTGTTNVHKHPQS